MVKVRGKFITLAASLMVLYKEALEKTDRQLFTETGKHWNELEPDGWYDVRHYNNFIGAYVESSASKENAMITFGKQIYPTVKRLDGFPANLKTPIDYLEFEVETYINAFKGPGIKPRKFIRKEPGYVIIQTVMPEQDCKTLEGVYMGIMKLAGVTKGKIEQNQMFEKGRTVSVNFILYGKSCKRS